MEAYCTIRYIILLFTQYNATVQLQVQIELKLNRILQESKRKRSVHDEIFL